MFIKFIRLIKMTVEINRKKDQKTQNNESNLEESLYSLYSSSQSFNTNNIDPKSSKNTILTEPIGNKSFLRVLGISVSFFELSNKINLLNLTFELKNTHFKELDSEFKTILKQEFTNTTNKKNSNKS